MYGVSDTYTPVIVILYETSDSKAASLLGCIVALSPQSCPLRDSENDPPEVDT